MPDRPDFDERLLTLDEAADYLSVSKTSLRRWTNEGRLACVRVGRRGERRFRLGDIKRFLEPSADRHGPGQRHARDPRHVLDSAAAQGVPRHVCLHYRDRDELWRLFRHYVVDHLRRDAPLVYIHEEGARADVHGRLRGEGFDPADLAARGLLRLLVPSEAYLRTGSFSAPRMVDFVESAILDRRALGHTSMLISGDMSWQLTGADGVDEMIPYEAALNGLLARYPDVSIVCNYDLLRLRGDVHMGALCSHPHAHLPDRMALGFYRAST
jgi:excisionase family DNA binding protein